MQAHSHWYDFWHNYSQNPPKTQWEMTYERHNIDPIITLPPYQTSLIDWLESSFAKFATRTAYIINEQTLSYQQLDKYSHIVANYLQSQGLKKGDRIGVMLPNLLHYPVVALGIVRAGLVLVSINPNDTEREFVHQIIDSQIQYFFILDKFQNKLLSVLDSLPSLQQVIICCEQDFDNIYQKAFKSVIHIGLGVQIQQHIAWFNRPIKRIYFSHLKKLTKSHLYQKPDCNLDDVVWVQYSGGSSGLAKGAMLTHGNIIANILQIDNLLLSAYEEDNEGDLVLTALPLYHVFSFSMCCILLIYRGFSGLLITNPSNTLDIIKAIRDNPPSFILGVNALFDSLLQHRSFRHLDFSQLKASIGGGMSILPKTAKTWQYITGTPIVEGYGLSELAPIISFNPLTIAQFTNKIGIPTPATDVKILDDNHDILPIGERGEIVVKGPQVMLGYQNLPTETSEAFTKDGYLKTGDIGIMDENGFIKVVDRKKDMMVVSGFNVYPHEIESVMSEHPDVLECVAIGVPNATRGEEPKIFVVRKNPQLTEKELIDFGKQNLAGYKRPRHVVFVESLPKSSSGKLLRQELRKREGLI